MNSFSWKNREELTLADVEQHNIFPRGYKLEEPTHEYLSHELVAGKLRNDKAGFFEAPSYAKALVNDFILQKLDNQKFITLTIREIDRDNVNKTRSINTKIWDKILQEIFDLGVKPIIIRDTSNSFAPRLFEDIDELNLASIHLPFRLGLYERALVNFTRNNGPSTLLLYGQSHSIFFNKFDNQVIALSEAWFANNYGMLADSQYPMTTNRTNFVWEDEKKDFIIETIKTRLHDKNFEEKMHGFSCTANAKLSISVALRHFVKCVRHNTMKEDATLLNAISVLNRKLKLGINFSSLADKLEQDQIPKGTFSNLKERYGLKI